LECLILEQQVLEYLTFEVLLEQVLVQQFSLSANNACTRSPNASSRATFALARAVARTALASASASFNRSDILYFPCGSEVIGEELQSNLYYCGSKDVAAF